MAVPGRRIGAANFIRNLTTQAATSNSHTSSILKIGLLITLAIPQIRNELPSMTFSGHYFDLHPRQYQKIENRTARFSDALS
jgi:hypothetical protein